MILDALLNLVAALLESIVGLLPSWSFVQPGIDSALTSVAQFLAASNALLPVREVWVVFALASLFISATLVVKMILKVVAFVPFIGGSG